MILSPFLTRGINLVLTLRHCLNCVDNVPFSLIPNVLHLSTRTIRFPHLHHFVERFSSSWQTGNWSEFPGANELQNYTLYNGFFLHLWF